MSSNFRTQQTESLKSITSQDQKALISINQVRKWGKSYPRKCHQRIKLNRYWRNCRILKNKSKFETEPVKKSSELFQTAHWGTRRKVSGFSVKPIFLSQSKKPHHRKRRSLKYTHISQWVTFKYQIHHGAGKGRTITIFRFAIEEETEGITLADLQGIDGYQKVSAAALLTTFFQYDPLDANPSCIYGRRDEEV